MSGRSGVEGEDFLTGRGAFPTGATLVRQTPAPSYCLSVIRKLRTFDQSAASPSLSGWVGGQVKERLGDAEGLLLAPPEVDDPLVIFASGAEAARRYVGAVHGR